MFKSKLSVVAIIALLSSSAFAWNNTGHEIVAAIAWRKLETATKIQIAKILVKGDVVTTHHQNGPDTTETFQLDPPTDGNYANPAYLEQHVRPMFVRGATWPDAIKGGVSARLESRITKLNKLSPDVLKASDSQQDRCKTWHYKDLPIQDPSDQSDHSPIRSNADYALKMAQDNLTALQHMSAPDRQEEALWLFFGEHIIGDLHQPLHCCSRFSASKPDGDDGGNGFKVRVAASTPGNLPSKSSLHTYWDSGVDHAKKLDPQLMSGMRNIDVADVWFDQNANLPADPGASSSDWNDWVKSGRQLAIDYAYQGLHENDVLALTDDYTKRQAALCKKQVILGGLRLANYLNTVLKVN